MKWGPERAPSNPSSLEEGQKACGKGFARGTCWKGKIAVSSEGDVYPCIFAREKSMGRFPEMKLEEIIQGTGTTEVVADNNG